MKPLAPLPLLPFLLAGAALGQTTCMRPGPDVLTGDIAITPANFTAAGGVDAFAFGYSTCNIGSAPLNFASATPMHPVTGQGLYRLRGVDGGLRLEQVGQGWLRHGFAPLQQNLCCAVCMPVGGEALGPSCSTPDVANTSASSLGPKWQVNPYTGSFQYPPANPAMTGPLARRLQVALPDLDPANQYFAEVYTVAFDDALTGNGANNASYRPVIISGGPADFAVSVPVAAPTVRGLPAISAWHAADPQVIEEWVSLPADGKVVVSSRATPRPGGGFHYEYAIYNLNSQSAIGTVTIPVPPGAAATGIDFHDVSYHDGDGLNNIDRDGTDWPATRQTRSITWATTPAATDFNANALRWGTMYNFRFDSDAPPEPAQMSLRPWLNPDTTILVRTIAPAQGCYANCDGSSIAPVLNVLDFGCFLSQFAAGEPYANCDGSTTPPALNVLDFTCFLNRFAAGCP